MPCVTRVAIISEYWSNDPKLVIPKSRLLGDFGPFGQTSMLASIKTVVDTLHDNIVMKRMAFESMPSHAPSLFPLPLTFTYLDNPLVSLPDFDARDGGPD